MHFYQSPTGLEIKKYLESHDPSKSSSRLPMLGDRAQAVLMFTTWLDLTPCQNKVVF